MLKTYLIAALQNWAAARTKQNWRGLWRLKKLALQWQMQGVQRIGSEIEITGPLVIQNAGTIEIGNQVILGATWYKPIVFSVARPDGRLIIENNVFINYGVDIGLMQEIVIGACAMIGNDCLLYDTDWHSLDGLEQEIPVAPTHIGRGAWLGARVIVMKGVTIGDNTVVAANSTVTHDLPPCVLAGGNPARVIRPIERSRYKPPVE